MIENQERAAVEPELDWTDPELVIEQLHAAHARQLHLFAQSMLRQHEDAEDVLQIAFLNAYLSIREGYRPVRPAAWLHRIVRNACLNRLRTHARRPAASLDGVEVPARHGLEEQLEQRSDAAVLRFAIEDLPVQQRRAVVLRELRGATYAEIADALATSEGAVESLLFRARRQMASSITSHGRGTVGKARTLIAH